MTYIILICIINMHHDLDQICDLLSTMYRYCYCYKIFLLLLLQLFYYYYYTTIIKLGLLLQWLFVDIYKAIMSHRHHTVHIHLIIIT